MKPCGESISLINKTKAATKTTKYMFDGGYLPKCLSVRSIGVSWKIVCVPGLERLQNKLYKNSQILRRLTLDYFFSPKRLFIYSIIYPFPTNRLKINKDLTI